MKAYRHGDLCLLEIKDLPEGLKKSTSKILMTGSGGNHHKYDVGEFYPVKQPGFVVGYFIAKKTKLLHRDHGVKKANSKFKEASIADGIYELRRQSEDTHQGMKPVQD